MAASNEVACGICDSLHVTKTASVWCPECEEGLCSGCQPHHMVSKATKHHTVIPVESYKKLPPSVSELLQYCTDHELKYTNFCQEHNAICCPGCISSSHNACLERIVLLQDVIKVSKSSSMLENVEQSCKDLKRNIDAVKEDRKQNLSKIQEQKQKIQTEIQKLRVKLNSHFDSLEKAINTELIAAEDKIRSKIEALLTKLSEESTCIDKLISNILAVKDYASDLQTFLSIRTIEEEVEKKEMLVKSLFQDESVQQMKLTLHINDKVPQILTSIATFGSVCTDKRPPSVQFTSEKDKQSQIIRVDRRTHEDNSG